MLLLIYFTELFLYLLNQSKIFYKSIKRYNNKKINNYYNFLKNKLNIYDTIIKYFNKFIIIGLRVAILILF